MGEEPVSPYPDSFPALNGGACRASWLGLGSVAIGT